METFWKHFGFSRCGYVKNIDPNLQSPLFSQTIFTYNRQKMSKNSTDMIRMMWGGDIPPCSIETFVNISDLDSKMSLFVTNTFLALPIHCSTLPYNPI